MQFGRTLLHYAADHGNCDVVDVLLSNKADADATDDVSVLRQMTAVLYSCHTLQTNHGGLMCRAC